MQIKRVLDNDKKAIGARIKQRRLDLGMTQQEVADKLSLNRVTYAQYEQGRNEIAASDLPRLAQMMRTTVAYFFGEESPLGAGENMPLALQEALGYASELFPDDQLLVYELWKNQASAHAGLAERRRQAEKELQEREARLEEARQKSGK